MLPEPGTKGRIIVFGIAFWYPLAGVTYQFLHYLLGLRRLGYDPYYVEDSGRWVYDPVLNDMSGDASGNVAAVAPVLESHGFARRWAFRGNYPGGRCYGMSEAELGQLYRDADACLNVTGAQELREEHLACPLRIYVESDPFASQVAVATGDRKVIDMLSQHHHHFTFGENIGAPDCDVPVERFHWQPTRQPVVLELWQSGARAPGLRYNTITTWQNRGKNITYRGETYSWTKDKQFEPFLALPARTTAELELAAGVNEDVRKLLHERGWKLADSVELSRDPARYRDYIQSARGEFTVARDQYVRPNTGWFSDRSACYLAAARPVVTQETGFSKFLPTGRGLFAFRTLNDAVEAIATIEADYEGSCRAARDIAHECFAAERVLPSLLARAGV